MEYSVNVHMWLELPMGVRQRLAQIFKVPKSQGSLVETTMSGAVVKSDGHTYEDLKAITVAKMQEFIKNYEETDFLKLWEATIGLATEEMEHEKPTAPQQPTAQDLLLQEWISVINRMRGQAVTMNMEDHLKHLVLQTLDIKIPNSDGTLTPNPKRANSRKQAK